MAMNEQNSLPGWKDKILFTPGPLTTSQTVKQAMLRDFGSRDSAFIQLVSDIRRRLVQLARANESTHTAIPMQGSGTFGVEAVLSSVVPPDGKLLVVANGAYGKRLALIARAQKIKHALLEFPESEVVPASAVKARLEADPEINILAIVHCETTTGLLNPIEEVGRICADHGVRYVVDAMSSFGGIPLDLPAASIDYLVSSANKCIEGVPGFSFAIARIEDLKKTAGWARSLCLDIHAQWEGLEKTGQFRFTPPTHALVAFHQALRELEAEGGVEARHRRYGQNHRVLVDGMKTLGFHEYLTRHLQGPIITSFRSPTHPNYDFERFYSLLNDRGYVIYPGKVSDGDCFRMGHIGRVFESDIRDLLAAVRDVLAEMKMDLGGGRA